MQYIILIFICFYFDIYLFLFILFLDFNTYMHIHLPAESIFLQKHDNAIDKKRRREYNIKGMAYTIFEKRRLR